jgi:hypothetical protein
MTASEREMFVMRIFMSTASAVITHKVQVTPALRASAGRPDGRPPPPLQPAGRSGRLKAAVASSLQPVRNALFGHCPPYRGDLASVRERGGAS